MRDDAASLRQTPNEVLEQRKATGEILRVITQSPTDAQPVFEILVSQRVAGAVEDLVSLEAPGPLTLKGFARPVPAFRVLALKT